MRGFIFHLVRILFFVILARAEWNLQKEYKGETFFDQFWFPSYKVEYMEVVNRSVAETYNLISVKPNGAIYMGVDHLTYITPNTNVSRMTVEINSLDQYSQGLFILDVQHSPSGCGVWPAFWLLGDVWPTDGEIDIIEGVNGQSYDQSTLHTGPNCTMQYEDTSSFTGIWMTGTNGQNATNCYANAPDQAQNQGCSINANNPQTFGQGFNNIGGGVFATLFDPTKEIAMWFFPRDNIPPDVQSYHPKPDTWIKPYAYFSLGSECPGSNFNKQTIIFDIGLCGQWAGSVFKEMCPGLGECVDYVDMHPEAMKEAYWEVNFLRIFQYSS